MALAMAMHKSNTRQASLNLCKYSCTGLRQLSRIHLRVNVLSQRIELHKLPQRVCILDHYTKMKYYLCFWPDF